jgi:hypothetical protein
MIPWDGALVGILLRGGIAARASACAENKHGGGKKSDNHAAQ